MRFRKGLRVAPRKSPPPVHFASSLPRAKFAKPAARGRPAKCASAATQTQRRARTRPLNLVSLQAGKLVSLAASSRAGFYLERRLKLERFKLKRVQHQRHCAQSKVSVWPPSRLAWHHSKSGANSSKFAGQPWPLAPNEADNRKLHELQRSLSAAPRRA